MVILSVVITGLVMTLAWTAGVHTQIANQTTKLDKASFAAEAGLNRAAWYIRHNTLGAQTQPLTGSLNGFTYSITWTSSGATAFKVTSTATDGLVSDTATAICTPPVVVPTYTLGGGTSGSYNLKNMTINGDVGFSGGVYVSSGNATINGNLTYGTTYNSSGITVTGTTTQKSLTPPVIDYAMLQSKAGLSYSSSQNNQTFDFTAVGGTNPVIYVNGSVTNPTFIGSGTLVVTGSISFSGGAGSAAKPVYLVAQQDISSGGGTFYGAIYAGGNWSHTASYTITGVVSVTGTDNSGNTANGTMYSAAAPWFDPRQSSAGLGVSFSNYSGSTP
jgi:hypothetical protein